MLRQERSLLIWRIIVTLCFIATLLFIFYNSSEIAYISGGKSLVATKWINGVFEKLNISLVLTEHFVRKLAHFLEYTLLGFLMFVMLAVYVKRYISHLSVPLFFGLLTPVLDESFQTLVKGRTGQVTDVLLDFSGVFAGVLGGLFVMLMIHIFRRKPNRRRRVNYY
ncbi:MAG: VanZ family protein [Clostridiales Family XIII bacterium]|jgi:VanZ family protein|nr:VanZ family protein [Clostridiales Family XIII bacterium]